MIVVHQGSDRQWTWHTELEESSECYCYWLILIERYAKSFLHLLKQCAWGSSWDLESSEGGDNWQTDKSIKSCYEFQIIFIIVKMHMCRASMDSFTCSNNKGVWGREGSSGLQERRNGRFDLKSTISSWADGAFRTLEKKRSSIVIINFHLRGVVRFKNRIVSTNKDEKDMESELQPVITIKQNYLFMKVSHLYFTRIKMDAWVLAGFLYCITEALGGNRRNATKLNSNILCLL